MNFDLNINLIFHSLIAISRTFWLFQCLLL
ncbi:unnamed protein product [Spirodela intermedia]|uniref:Uncharacterized protein n=1 Tax=Spirodela intermedia TaxID=51605 RepID=A0A7I8J2H7_SPIIN|nr:unnamed protein product [Spirodela intermedia]CAA6664426.1 unnamed protein product [Spirodela intermedia]